MNLHRLKYVYVLIDNGKLMKNILYIAIISVLFPLSSIAENLPDPRSFVDNGALFSNVRAAAMGSHEHSYWLSEYYIDAVSNPKEGEFWLRLSAEQGDCRGIKEYIRFVRSQYGEAGLLAPHLKRLSSHECSAVTK